MISGVIEVDLNWFVLILERKYGGDPKAFSFPKHSLSSFLDL